MEPKKKEIIFRELQLQIDNNTQLILTYKKISPIVMLLFIILAFFTFYNNSIRVHNANQVFFICTQIILFMVLILFYITIENKKKQNKRLNHKIYNLLKL